MTSEITHKTNIKSLYENIGNLETKVLKPEILKKNEQLNKLDQVNDLKIIPDQLYSIKNKKNSSFSCLSDDLSGIYYYTKVINWYDKKTESIVQRTIVCQNENSPYPIIPLANLFILQDSSGNFLSGYSLQNSQISASSLLSIIANYVVSSVSEEHLDNILPRLPLLHKCLNVNPCFKDISRFDGEESKIFSILGVQLFHGWLPSLQEDGFDIYNAIIKAETYENALEKISIMKELLENKNLEYASSDEKISEGRLLNRFLCSYPRCLTPHGITVLREKMSPGNLSILFHNLHFSLLYSHYQTGDLYTLVTDYAYKDYENKVVWESLETSLYFNSDFILQDNLFNDLSGINNDFSLALNMQLMEDQQKENWVYYLSQSKKYKKHKTSGKVKEKKKNSRSNNDVVPSWKRRASDSFEKLNKHLQKEKKCIIF
ncbi:hypothetical protein PNEG_02600 [Pneumocystis murina B123]|uniref:MINDY deubiquitinase domain-containing protein n=1 Tax=Pneumocystis murina (strain B123) TaxID=1069680 RepID=M7NQB1_PNEMU|nr:hypothetical protein PNEG_02600 [Pneumocystis murina B123]EMR09266.1 hypothetical protein PNEG_02600 [Pneumocystis murina B123]